MRRLLVPTFFLLASCEQQAAPPSPPAAAPKPNPIAPSPPPAKTTTTAAPAAAPTPDASGGLQVGKALGLSPHPAGVEPGPDDPYIAAMVRAIEARKKNDAKAAEVEYRAALKAQPKDANALAGVAEMLFAQDKADQALQPAGLAYELKPTDPEVRWVFGLVFLSKNKRTEDAMAAWEALIKDTPDYAKQLGVAERLKVIKAYSKGAPHGGKTAPKGPASAPAGGPSSAPAPK